MASQKTIEQRKAILRARGVPEKFVHNLATRKSGVGFLVISVLLLIVPMIAVPAALLGASHLTIGWLYAALYPDARTSLLFLGEVPTLGLSLGAFMLAILIYMGIAIWHASRPVRPYPGADATASRLRALAQTETVDTLKRDTHYANLDHLADDRAFLTAIAPKTSDAQSRANRKSVVILITCIVVMTGVFLSLPIIAFSRYVLVRGDTVELHDFRYQRQYALSAARQTYVRCHDNTGGTPDFDYGVEYPDVYISLYQSSDVVHNLNEPQVIARLSVIAARLDAMHIKVHRLVSGGSLADDAEDCVNDVARTWSAADRARLHQLVFGS